MCPLHHHPTQNDTVQTQNARPQIYSIQTHMGGSQRGLQADHSYFFAIGHSRFGARTQRENFFLEKNCSLLIQVKVDLNFNTMKTRKSIFLKIKCQ